jgi:SAM-dependent methyltransferase
VSKPIRADEFEREYVRAVDDVLRFLTPERQALIAKHDLSLHPDRYDMGAYLTQSRLRYAQAIEMIGRHHDWAQPLTLLDVGGFMASFPLALARLGVEATLAEKYGYYYGAFDDLRDYLIQNGVRVWDVDFSDPGEKFPDGRFAAITNMAMIEHLAHTPRPLLENIHSRLLDTGHFLIEVPNIAYWPKRIAALRGNTVHGDIEFVYRAAAPFMGHHREYTRDELERVLAWSGYDVEDLITINYSWNYHADPVRNLYYAVLYEWPMRRFESCREVIMAVARKSSTG